MIGCTVIKFAYIFEDCGEVKEILPKCQLLKNMYGYIGSALVDSYDNHVCTVLGGKERVTCFVPHAKPNNLFRKHDS